MYWSKIDPLLYGQAFELKAKGRSLTDKVVVQLSFCELMNKFCQWIYHHKGSLVKYSWIIIPTTLVKSIYMEISVPIIEKSILFKTIKNMHDTVAKIVSISVFTATD